MSSEDRKPPSKAEGTARDASPQAKSPSPRAPASFQTGIATVRNGDERLLAQIGYQQVHAPRGAAAYVWLNPTFRNCAASSASGLLHPMRLPFLASLAPSPPCSRSHSPPAVPQRQYGAGSWDLSWPTPSLARV